jgi:hypothetical protein
MAELGKKPALWRFKRMVVIPKLASPSGAGLASFKSMGDILLCPKVWVASNRSKREISCDPGITNYYTMIKKIVDMIM